jgi:hypothetical protein
MSDSSLGVSVSPVKVPCDCSDLDFDSLDPCYRALEVMYLKFTHDTVKKPSRIEHLSACPLTNISRAFPCSLLRPALNVK